MPARLINSYFSRRILLSARTNSDVLPRSATVILFALFVLASCGSMFAQNLVATGSLRGQVTDSSGAVVPGASVLVRSFATGVEKSAKTNSAGIYHVPALVPGSYSVLTSGKGFRDAEAVVEVLV